MDFTPCKVVTEKKEPVYKLLSLPFPPVVKWLSVVLGKKLGKKNWTVAAIME